MGVGTIAGVVGFVIAVGPALKWGLGKVRERRSKQAATERQKQRVRRRSALRHSR